MPTRRANLVPVEGVGCYLPLICFGCTDPHADLSSQEQQHWAEVEKLANRDLVPMGHSGAGVEAWRQETHWEDWHLPSRIWLLCSVLEGLCGSCPFLSDPKPSCLPVPQQMCPASHVRKL